MRTWTTRYTLLEKLQAGDQLAWDDFVFHYRPFIYYLLNNLKVRPPDQEDLIQLILLKLHENLPRYIKEKGSFRNWLQTIIHNTTVNFFIKEGRYQKKNEAFSEAQSHFNSYSQSELNETIDQDWQRFLLKKSLERLSSVVAPQSIECFELTVEGVSGEDIADKLGVQLETVYKIRTRMKSRILKEVQQLIQELEF